MRPTPNVPTKPLSLPSARPFIQALLATGLAALTGCGPIESREAPAGESPDPQAPSVPPSAVAGAPGLDPEIFPKPGTTAFLTANENELLSLGTGRAQGANGRGELSPEADGDFAEGAAGGADPGADPGQVPNEPEAVPDPSREIVEADVYKLEGDLLYVLNRWRGLVIIDVSDTSNLRIVGRLPFQAMPVEMYVREGRAYIVMSDYFEYWQYDPEADPHGFHGSQVLIADVSVPARPVALGRLPVDGEVTDTRMVGDVLYTVSHRRPDYWRYNTADWEDRTWIVSLNIADPQDIQEIDRITFAGQSTLIHVAPHAIFVAAWDPNFYLTDPLHEQETLVTYVDISDAGGDLRERGKVYIPGQIADKFKMDWFDGHFRVLSQHWQSDENITLQIVDTDPPDDLEIDASLALEGVTNSGLLASRFDGERAFAATARWNNRQIDELHTLDLSDPAHPARGDVLRIDQQVSHFEIHGDRLLALGQHIPDNWQGDHRVALGLYDIADLSAPRAIDVQRLGEGHSGSEANGDYKALKVFPDLSLILVPLTYWVPNANRNFDGVQLVDWRDDQLTERGRVQSRGGVRRAFPVGEGDAEHLIAVGDQSILSIDATDRDHPTVDDARDLIHQVHDVYDVQGLQVQIVGDIYSGEIRAEVRPFGREDDAPEIAHVVLPFQGPPNVFREGDMLHLLGYANRPNNGGGGQLIRNLDLTNPREPRLRGELWITDDYQYVYNQGQSFYARYWSPDAGLPLNDNLLPLTYRHVVEGASGRRDFESELRFIDLSDPDHPRIARGSVPMNDFPFVNKVTHGNVLVSTHVEQATTESGEQLLYHVRSFADRVDVSDPDHPVALPSVNVPGYVVDVSADGSLLFTVDFQWDDFGRRRNSLNVLKFTADDTAELVTVVPVPDQINRAAFRPDGDGLTVWTAAHKYPWWGVRGDTVASRQPYTMLSRLDFCAEGHLDTERSASLQGYHFDLLDIEGDQAWLASTGPYGLLTLDVTDAAHPAIDFTARTLGYLSRIVVNEGHVYTPMGWFGVHRY